MAPEGNLSKRCTASRQSNTDAALIAAAMEVVLQGTEGLPESALLSIKWGDTKRQASVSKIGQKLRFSNSATDPLPMKVEVFTPVAPPQLVQIDPTKEAFEVALGSNMKVKLQQRAAQELQKPVVDVKSAAVEKGFAADKQKSAQEAAAYLEEHNILRTFQDMLASLITSKPKDPHAYVEAHIAKLKKPEVKEKGKPPVNKKTIESISDGEMGAGPRDNRRGSVRQHMRENMSQLDPGAKQRGSLVTGTKVETLLMTLQAASDNLAIAMPFLPVDLRQSIESAEFRAECEQHFKNLDKEDRGELTSDDLLDVIAYLVQGKKESIGKEQCRKFAQMFDDDEDDLINISEFTGMVQFVTVASYLETEEGQRVIQQAMVNENTFQDFIGMIEGDKERLWSIIPFLPEWLVDHVTSYEFQQGCHKQFDELDADKSGVLEPAELVPVIQAISQTGDGHVVNIDEAKCQQFIDLFDTLGNGVIVRDEFIEFAQFLTVMNFLSNTTEGQAVAQRADLTSSAERTRQNIAMLEQDPLRVLDVISSLPKAFVQELNSQKLDQACFAGFKEAVGGSEDPTARVPPGQLVTVIQDLCKTHPFNVSDEQCNYWISKWDTEQSNSVTSTDFMALARYVMIMGFLMYQQENQNMLIADVMMGEERMMAMLYELKKGAQSVWNMMPFLPEELVDELTSAEFEEQCMRDFSSLDADGSGVLEPNELMPVVQALTKAHEYTLTEEHCRRFVDIFDIERNGVITKTEFVHFVRFMMVMSYMETPEGQLTAMEAEVDRGNRDVEKLILQLENDRSAIEKVMPLLPQEVYTDLTSPAFISEVRKTFKELDKDNSGVLEPIEVYPLIVDLTASHPYAVSMDQCTRFTAIFDLRGDGVLRQDEFLDFTRFLCIMSYLSSDVGQVAAAEALRVLDDHKRIEDLLVNLQSDREAVSKVVPYLPMALRQELLSEKFTIDCINYFQGLDKDGNGVLDPEELTPMVKELIDAHDMAFDKDKCKRFAAVFDDNGDGMIEAGEFVNFARFMVVLSFLEKEEGQLTLALAQEDYEAKEMLSAGRNVPPPATPELMGNMPEPPPLMLSADAFAPAADPQGAHLAVDYEFYREKAEKLGAENDTMREHMASLEAMVRKMQRQIEEQDIKLRHAEVDLRARR